MPPPMRAAPAPPRCRCPRFIDGGGARLTGQNRHCERRHRRSDPGSLLDETAKTPSPCPSPQGERDAVSGSVRPSPLGETAGVRGLATGFFRQRPPDVNASTGASLVHRRRYPQPCRRPASRRRPVSQNCLSTYRLAPIVSAFGPWGARHGYCVDFPKTFREGHMGNRPRVRRRLGRCGEVVVSKSPWQARGSRCRRHAIRHSGGRTGLRHQQEPNEPPPDRAGEAVPATRSGPP